FFSCRRRHTCFSRDWSSDVCSSDLAVTFRYEDRWRERPDSFPLSLSMPLSVKDHDNRVVNPYLWNLLPDNDEVLRTWARNFGVRSEERRVGTECRTRSSS